MVLVVGCRNGRIQTWEDSLGHVARKVALDAGPHCNVAVGADLVVHRGRYCAYLVTDNVRSLENLVPLTLDHRIFHLFFG